jgi:POT family proton-dependent oligopeptide transporter
MGVYAINTVAELCLSPVGLSAVTRLAPTRMASMTMGAWFVSAAAAYYTAGILEKVLGQWQLPLYGFLAALLFAAGLLLLLLGPVLSLWATGSFRRAVNLTASYRS